MKPRPSIALLLGVMMILSLLSALMPARGEASPLLLPTRPEDVSGDGNGSNGNNDGDNEDDKDDDKPAGAHIELYVRSVPSGAWSVVQWQDSTGGWHDVEGWRGTLDERGIKRWWVHPKDFSTGPFHWLVTRGTGGPVLRTSEPFNLPHEPGYTLVVEVP